MILHAFHFFCIFCIDLMVRARKDQLIPLDNNRTRTWMINKRIANHSKIERIRIEKDCFARLTINQLNVTMKIHVRQSRKDPNVDVVRQSIQDTDVQQIEIVIGHFFHLFLSFERTELSEPNCSFFNYLHRTVTSLE